MPSAPEYCGTIGAERFSPQHIVGRIDDVVAVVVARKCRADRRLQLEGPDIGGGADDARIATPALIGVEALGIASEVNRRTVGRQRVRERRPAVVGQWTKQRVVGGDRNRLVVGLRANQIVGTGDSELGHSSSARSETRAADTLASLWPMIEL